MRAERGVVEEGAVGFVVKVGDRQRRHEPDVEKFLERSPETLDDGDRAGAADGAEALTDAEALELRDERTSGELRSVIGDEVARVSIARGGLFDERGDLLARRFLPEDPEGQRKAGKDVENHDELEAPEPEETEDRGDVGHPDVVRLFRAKNERLVATGVGPRRGRGPRRGVGVKNYCLAQFWNATGAMNTWRL